MFTFSSFRKILLGITITNLSIIGGSIYIFKKNRPENDIYDEPKEEYRIKLFDYLSKTYDEQNDFIEKVTSIKKYRKKHFRNVKGVVLEIGSGTGRNLSYIKDIDVLICVDKSQNMCEVLKEKIQKIKPKYDIYIIHGDISEIQFNECVFDSVISSFTLCSIEKIDDSLKNIYKSMKNQSKFFLIERGIINNKYLRFFLNKLNLYPNRKIPWNYGYYENKNILQILKNNNFNIIFKVIKNAGTIYILIAKKKTNSFNIFNKENKENKDNKENKPININNILKYPIPIYYKYNYSN